MTLDSWIVRDSLFQNFPNNSGVKSHDSWIVHSLADSTIAQKWGGGCAYLLRIHGYMQRRTYPMLPQHRSWILHEALQEFPRVCNRPRWCPPSSDPSAIVWLRVPAPPKMGPNPGIKHHRSDFRFETLTRGRIRRRAVEVALVNILIRIPINGTTVFLFKDTSCLGSCFTMFKVSESKGQQCFF